MSRQQDKDNSKKPMRIDADTQAGCVDCSKQCCGSSCHKGDARCKLNAYDWLSDVPGGGNDFDIVEVHFKNTRKGFYRNSAHLPLQVGDMVAVEANPGHDIGRVSMMGRLVKLQMKRANLRPDFEILRVFRKAKPSDLERFEEAKAKEVDTMIRSRKIAADLHLKMKIGDVEYQGDGNKAIFYYIADERVDFRQLIKVLADVFKIRVEMKQIGARQEAGRIGGIGPCGRPLCCASWMTNFVSVATSAARFQDISLNPQKLAGQCAKLKCCINFEVDGYVEATKKLPPRDVTLETKDNTYYHFKTDIFKKEITYSTDKQIPANLVTIKASRVFEVMALNRNGVKPDKLQPEGEEKKEERKAFGDIIGQDSISRFDKKKKKKGKGGSNDNGGGKRQDHPKQGGRGKQGQAETANAPKQQQGGKKQNPKKEQGERQGGKPRQQGSNPQQQQPRQQQQSGEAQQHPEQQRRDRQPRQRGNRRQPKNENNQQNNNNGQAKNEQRQNSGNKPENKQAPQQ